MARIKYTKNELKAQKDALARFERFLPMLQLKKQQLQAEVMAIRQRMDGIESRVAAEERSMAVWVSLLADRSVAVPVALEEVETAPGNIAGLTIPLFKGVRLRRPETDLHATPAWVDDAAESCGRLMGWRAELEVLRVQREAIEEELRTTAQRVNLFEKVKIPECRENIRIIRIHIGDEQTSAVARGKIAKGRGRQDTASPLGREDAA